MAVQKSARVERARSAGSTGVLLDVHAADPLGFVGGQYVIVDTGLVLPNGKGVKRAHSVLSADDDQHHFQLAVHRIPGGPGSGFMNELEAGAELRFSGPWGKFHPAADAAGPTLVLATDTGITAALGAVRGARFRSLLEHSTFVWLRTFSVYFLPEEVVRGALPNSGMEVVIDDLPPDGHPERVSHVRKMLAALLARNVPRHAMIAGDAAVQPPLAEDLVSAGVPPERIQLEAFFNMPKKSA